MNINRSARRLTRTSLTAAAALAIGASGLIAGPASAAPNTDKANPAATCAGRSVPANKISFQLFSYRSWQQQPGVGTEGLLAELAEIGYKNVEPHAGTYEGRTAEEFSALLKEYKLKAPTAHEYIVNEATFDARIDFAKTVGQKYMGSGGFALAGVQDNSSYDQLVDIAEAMNRLGERSVTAGTGKFFGHNHHREFTTKVVDPATGELKSAWEVLVENTDPRYVTFQLDILWAEDAGVDTAALIEKYGKRIELLHIKDGLLNGEARAIPTDVGEGEIDWAPILQAAHGKVKYYVVERDGAPATPEFARDTFEFLTCFNY